MYKNIVMNFEDINLYFGDMCLLITKVKEKEKKIDVKKREKKWKLYGYIQEV